MREFSVKFGTNVNERKVSLEVTRDVAIPRRPIKCRHSICKNDTKSLIIIKRIKEGMPENYFCVWPSTIRC